MAAVQSGTERVPPARSPRGLRLAFVGLLITPGLAAAGDPVSLQLKWRHQFQFAGYYAAQAKGYYAAEGLDVTILEGARDRPAIATVLRGGADFGVGDADVLLARLKGEPLVVCAAIFQHSPYVILSRRERGIRTPADLVGARVMLSDHQGAAQLRGMLVREGIDPARVDIRESSWDLADLIEGRVDAVSAYATVQPQVLRAKGIEPVLLRSIDYGVDFYGDTLFTTESQVRQKPQRVAAFLRASLRGWTYALEHPEEMADLVSKMDGVAQRGVDRELLLHEAREMRPYIVPDLVEIGHMNPGRWQRNGETFVALGMAPSTSRLEGFIYDPGRRDPAAVRTLLWLGLASILLTGAVVLWNVQMRGSVRQRIREINKIQQRLALIYDTVGDVLFLIAVEDDGGFRFESVNKRFAATTGLPAEAVVGKRVEEVVPEGSLAVVLRRYREAIERKTIVRWEETSDYPAGRLTGEVSVAPISDLSGRCTHLVGAVHDVTERKAAEERHERAEEMLRQSQKLEGIGRLAGGIAHDFNNILGVILGYGELMRRQVGEDHAARPRLEQVIQAAQRAAGLTRQLLAFSRKQVMQPKLLDLGAMVHDLRQMLERVVGEDLEIEVRAAKGLGAVNADPTQVEQVIMNLVVNARDAMPKGGQLTIETANAEFDEAYAAAHPPAQAGEFVMLAVSDTGVGMDAETQMHIFEPFFTTKPLGEGTGLGLATVYGIVKQMRGYVWIYSEVGHGTSFKVYLPRVTAGVAVAPAPAVAPSLPLGRETVLVVEDSESLRDLIRELLEEQGYTVLSATQGEEALALVRERTGAIDLLLTDVVMPKLGGGDLVKQVRAIRPEIRALYMSGYTSGAVARQGVLGEGERLLEKPFTGEQLTRAVRQALDAELAPPGGTGDEAVA